nr:DUF2220 family protein [Variovorax paradoxus]
MKLDAKVLPELYGVAGPNEVGRIELLLEGLTASGWVRLRLNKPRAFQTFTDRNPALELFDFEALATWCGFVPKGEAWNRRFVEHLRDSDSFEVADKPALLDYLLRSPLTALNHLEFSDAERCLSNLRAMCASGRATYLREASALSFHGRSKVLDAREELLRLLGATDGQLTEGPIQLLCSVPVGGFEDVLFVENLITFERMCDGRGSAWASTALVFASGFKSGARRVRQPAGSRLYFREHVAGCDAFGDWLYGAGAQPVSFFGDLDYSGMQILANLRVAFPICTGWEPGYRALLAMLKTGCGHAPYQADKAGQVDPGSTGCRFADCELLPAMRSLNLFVDQEAWSM